MKLVGALSDVDMELSLDDCKERLAAIQAVGGLELITPRSTVKTELLTAVTRQAQHHIMLRHILLCLHCLHRLHCLHSLHRFSLALHCACSLHRLHRLRSFHCLHAFHRRHA